MTDDRVYAAEVHHAAALLDYLEHIDDPSMDLLRRLQAARSELHNAYAEQMP